MARYLVVEFLDNDEAESFMAKVDDQTRKGKRYRVVGMFSPPRIYACKCPISSGSSSALYRKPKSERGGKFGWWLCGVCKKPRPGGHQLNNLLEPKQLFGKKPRKKALSSEDAIDGRNYEWQIKGLDIAELPLHNIGRKKKRWI